MRERIGYLGAIAVTVCALIPGLGLHWMAALGGPGIGLFGIDAWVGAFASLVILVGGIWLWRRTGRHVDIWTKRVGRLVLIAVAAGTFIGAEWLVASSWAVVCSPERPTLCYHYGELLGPNEIDDRRRHAYRLACEGGDAEGCRWIVDHVERPADREWACDILADGIDGAPDRRVEKCTHD